MATTSIKHTVDPISFPLRGSSLIEASAGTGKTWTIAALYLRLVLGHGTESARLPEEILVLTFTKAAARELKDRIRQRLNQAAEFFRSDLGGDDYLIALKNSIPADKHSYSAYLLSIAAQSMDMAAISTIHSWCEKALKQHAFESGSLFDLALTEDISTEKHDVVWDYWRKHVTNLPADKYAQVIDIWSGPSALKEIVNYIDLKKLPELETTDLSLLLEQFSVDRANRINELKTYWQTAGEELWHWLNSLGDKFKLTRYYRGWVNDLLQWANSDADSLDLKTGWKRLAPDDIQEKYLGDDLDIIAASYAINDLQKELQELSSPKGLLYKHALICLSKSLHKALSEKSVLNFDGLLIHMDQALAGENADLLAQTLRKQYPIVLIDEFQDTDPIQYSIFNKIYQVKKNLSDSTVIFIGDPKQSIYRFRGADIYTYISALIDCGNRVYTLNKNFRSVENMVGAVNEFFSAADDVFITADKKHSLDFTSVEANGIDEKLLINNQQLTAISGLWLDNEEKNIGIGKYRELAAKACAQEITRILNLANNNQAVIYKANKSIPIRPLDIAVLVNNAIEAKLIQTALSDANIRSVYLSEKTNVYESQQAIELKFWLMACLEPLNIRAVSAALACPSFGISYCNLFSIKNDEHSLDSHIDRFIKYNEIWHKRGILPMLYKLLHDFNVPSILLANQRIGERSLTNFLHLADLLQNASLNLDGPQALLHYLNQQISNNVQSDANLLRLESDDDLVRITTIHKSKGLEYPMVFLPFVCAGRETPLTINLPLNTKLENGDEWVFNLDSDLIDKYTTDELGEEVRKLYVAITRARHSVWLTLKHDAKKRISGISHLFANNTKSGFDKLCAQFPERFKLEILQDSDESLIINNNNLDLKKEIRTLNKPAVSESWWVSSYSALHLGNVQTSDYLEYNLFEDDLAESISSISNQPDVKDLVKPEQLLSNIPKGSTTGTFLHGILQSAAQDNFNNALDLRDLIARRCAVRGWQEHIDDLHIWLTNFLNNSWHINFNGSDFKFNDLCSSYAELEFLIPVKKLNTKKIDDLISNNFYPQYDRPLLLPQQLNGMFKGYIDLCFQNLDNRYYVLDYKSNYLDDYSDEHLLRSMLSMRYDVQMILYSLVLHKQLKMRLPDYDYERDFGGAIYLYLRGQNYPNQGLLSFKPNLDLLDSLENIFLGQGVNNYA